ncbi:MAG: carbohydrate kinase family protein, partial [Armatimonadetes bacterium]
MYDLISIGDSAIDHFCKIHDARVITNGKNLQEELCFYFGDKLPVEKYEQILGGNNGNNCVGAARLGLKVGIYTNIGTDAAGKSILEGFKKEGVDTRYVKVNHDSDSNVSILISYKGERTILVYQQPWEYQLPDLDKCRWVYLSSMAETFKKSMVVDHLAAYLSRTGVCLAFNPGTYQLEPGLKRFNSLLILTTLLVVNREEAELILGVAGEKRTEVKKLLRGLSELGPKMVVVTDGEEGSFGYNG